MRKSKSRKENNLLAGCLFLILFLIVASWLIIPALRTPLAESQRMTALQSRGVVVIGCVTLKDAHESFRGLPELIYRFQTTSGEFEGRVKVTSEFFDQVNVGTCLNIVYLPDDPNTNSMQSYVDAFNLGEYWSEHIRLSLHAVAFAVFVIVGAIFNYYRRRGVYKRK